jgi:hypothetical protein
MSSASRRERDLVFDLGLHNGDDAAYYLDLGYLVVGVEANLLLAGATSIEPAGPGRRQWFPALSRGATLVTHNTREFARVRGLRLADWTG